MFEITCPNTRIYFNVVAKGRMLQTILLNSDYFIKSPFHCILEQNILMYTH